MKNFKQFLLEDDGMGTVEVILIIVVLVGLVIVFRSQISGIVTKIFKSINEGVESVTSPSSQTGLSVIK